MAENIKIGVALDDGGTTEKLTAKTLKLKENIDNVTSSASRMGSVVAKATMAPKTSEAIKDASKSPQESIKYGQARAAAGTGAAGRDFAKQAQGLGGLVHLYATFAANIFAVSAAYRALSNAADTTNLIKGLDMLGAASGKSLGTLSKRLVEVTDGAISMREAMSAVAQTSSAGMSSKNIEKLAGVAKNASLALGISMPDALSRLSRGITKLEPELLDELGLFTKIGPATEKYALSIGKTATQLTDFEKRQAFANAVIEEGENKFNALAKASANPYDKLFASLSNVMQGGLEVVNKVLTPVVDFLSKSPTALLAGLATVATILIKQAIPALGQFRNNLEMSAKLAGEAAVGKVGEAKAAREQLNRVIEAKVEQSADAQLEIFEKLESKMYATAAAGTSRRSALWKTLKKQVTDVGEEDLAQSERSVKALERRAKKDPSLQGQATLERATLDQLKAVINKEEELNKLRLENKKSIEENLKVSGTYARIQKAAADYEISAKKQAIVSNAAYNASLLGIGNAWILVKEEIAASDLKLSLFGKGLLYVRAGMGTLVGIVGTLGSAINKAFMVFTFIAGIFSTLDSLFSKNSKEASNFASSLDAAYESAANVERTLAAATSKEGFGTATIQNTVALSNAFNELTDSANKAIATAEEAARAASGWDRFWDNVFGLFGKDRDSKLADAIAKQISSGFDILASEGLDAEYTKKLTKLLGVDNLKDTELVAEKFKKLSKDQKESIGSIIQDSNRLLGNLSSTLQSFKDKSDQANKSYKEYLLSLADNNPLFKLGRDLLDLGVTMQKVADGGVNEVAKAFEDLTKNPEKAALFGESFIKEFVKIKAAFESQKQAIDANAKALAAYKSQLASIKPGREGLTTVQPSSMTTPTSSTARGQQALLGVGNRAYLSDKENLQENIRLLNKAGSQIPRDMLDAGVALARKGVADLISEGTRLVNKAVSEAKAAAGIMIERALTSNLTGATKAASEGRLRDKEIQVQIEAVNTAESLYNKQSELVDQTKIANALQVETNALLKLSLAKPEDKASAQKALEDASKGVRISRGDYSGLENSAELQKQAETLKSVGAKQFEAQRARLGGQLTASKITTGVGVTAGKVQEERELEALEQRKNAAIVARYDVLTSISGITSTELIVQKQLAEQVELEKRQKQEIKAIDDKIDEAEKLRLEAEKQKKPDAAAEQVAQKATLERLKTGTKAAQVEESGLVIAKNKQALISEEIDKVNKRYEVIRSQAELEKTIAQDSLDYQAQELSLYSSAYDLSKDYVINQQTSLDKQKALAEASSAMQQAQDALNQKREEAEIRIASIQKEGGAGSAAAIAAINTELARQEVLTNNNITGLSVQYNSKIALLEKTKEINLEQARYNELLDNASSLASQLSKTFGEVGTKLGAIATSFAKYAVSSEKNTKAQEKLQSELNSAKGTDKEKAAQTALDKQKRKAAKEDLDNISDAASATKQFFKEKSAAYKALSAVEQTTAAISMALKVQDMAVTLSTMPAKIAGGVAKLFEQGGWAGFVGAAAFLAIMSKFGMGSIAGGAAAPPPGQSAEDRQKTQGTAMGYDAQGNLVQTSRGVFGDTEAKSASIVNSLEIIKNTSVKGLDYDDKMLRALTNLANALDTTAKGLYAITGIRAGSLSGVVEGTNTGGGFLGIGGLFSSSTTKSIIDSGLQLKGTFLQLVNGVESTINVFETISTTVKKSGFFGIGGSTSTYVSTNFKQLSGLDPKAFQSLVSAFGYAADLLYNVADIAGKSSDEVTHAMSLIRVDQMASLRGLTGEEFTKQLSAVISSVLDETSLIIFAEYEKFAKFGEGMLETVVRVIDGNRKVSKQIDNMMINSIEDTLKRTGTVPAYKQAVSYSIQNLSNVTADEAYRAAQVLGDDSKISSIGTLFASWFGNTLTSSVQNQIQNLSQDDLRKLSDAGVSFVTKSINIISDGITTSFAEADLRIASIQITENLVTLAGSLENFLDQSNFFIDNFLTDAEKLVPVQKAVIKQLTAMGYASVSTKDEFKSLVQSLDLTTISGQETYQKLMDLAPGFMEIIDLVDTQSQTIKDAIVNFKDFIQQIKDFKASLLLGTSSILTPGEKYAEAKSQFDEMYAKALAGDKIAMSKVTASAQSFLDASRTYFASSDQYSLDFTTILAKLDAASISAGASASVAELQLSALNIHTDLLSSINQNIALIAGVPAAASGGRVSGLTLVGEMGPELVDFSTPGRVYTADQTAGMFTPNTGNIGQQQLIQEVRNLRQEVAKLREQQNTETGHIITATYDAQLKNAEQVTEGVTEAAARQAWAASLSQSAIIN